MNREQEIKQACLDLSKAAMAIFDRVDEKGLLSPIDDQDGLMELLALVDNGEKIRDFYHMANIQRMLALGVSPEQLLKTTRFRE